MLVKLTPDQVAKYWDALRPMIEAALPPVASQDSERRMNYILSKLLSDNMQCWVIQRDGVVMAVGTTIIQEDGASGARALLLYSVFSTGANGDDWREAYETMSKWAVSKGCQHFVAYTTNKDVVKLAERFEASFWVYLIIPFVH